MKDFRRTWKKACAYAGVPGLLVHDLRRTGARSLRRAGVAEAVIMRIGSWKTRSVFERYNIIDQSDPDQAVEKVEKYEARLPYSSPTVAQVPVQIADGEVVN